MKKERKGKNETRGEEIYSDASVKPSFHAKWLCAVA